MSDSNPSRTPREAEIPLRSAREDASTPSDNGPLNGPEGGSTVTLSKKTLMGGVMAAAGLVVLLLIIILVSASTSTPPAPKDESKVQPTKTTDSHHGEERPPPGPPPTEIQTWCEQRETRAGWRYPNMNSHNHKKKTQTKAVVIKNANLYYGDDVELMKKGWIRFENGRIDKIGGETAPENSDDLTIDAKGMAVTAGIVDMHNHVGVWGSPHFMTNDDSNESGDSPVTPMVRALDGFHTEDWTIPRIQAGGISAVLCLPGSGNAFGGEALMAKVIKRDNLMLEDMLIDGAPKAIKMACGENPKWWGTEFHKSPTTRMGLAWLWRQEFEKARNQLAKEKEYCRKANTPAEWGGLPQPHQIQDLSLEAVVGVLKGMVNTHIHCYKDHDMEVLLRIAEEFNFNITAFHHAADAYRVTELLKESGTSIATHSDIWLSKWETFNASVWGPGVLEREGVKYSIVSDHTVTNSHDLIMEAAKTRFWGASHSSALASITKNPAEIMGLGDTMGKLKEGMHADIVLWQDSDPLTLGNIPKQLWVEGIDQKIDPDPYSQNHMDMDTGKNGTLTIAQEPFSKKKSKGYMIKNAMIYHLTDKSDDLDANRFLGDLVVVDGMIECLKPVGKCAAPQAGLIMEADGAVIMPGIISVESVVGMDDVGRVSSAMDGHLSASDANAEVRAIDGVVLFGSERKQAVAGGVTTVVSAPLQHTFVAGQSGAFDLHGETLVYPTDITWMQGMDMEVNVIKEGASLDFHIGLESKGSGLTGAVSGQMRKLTELFTQKNPSVTFQAAKNGTLPVHVHANTADVIATAVRRLKSIAPKMHLTIVGGAEAWVVRDLLAKYGVGVVLHPARCTRGATWSQRRCRMNGGQLLTDAGVKVGLASGWGAWSHNLRWDAGMQAARGMKAIAAMRTITSNLAEFCQLGKGRGQLVKGTKANFAVFSANPLTFEGEILMIGSGIHLQSKPRML